MLKLFDHLEIAVAFIDCVECYTAKMFFETIVNRLNSHVLTPNNNFENYQSCDGPEDFIDILNSMDAHKPYVVILKNFDRLHNIETNILPIVMRLNRLVPTLNICCILISSHSLTTYVGKMDLIPTINIHCEQYGKEDLRQILTKQIDHLRKIMTEIINEGDSDKDLRSKRLVILGQLDDTFFTGYFNIFLDTFFLICRNAKELVYLSNANFPIYCKPVIDGELRSNDLLKLWKNMDLPFKMAMNSIYRRVDQQNQTNIVSIFKYF